MFFEIIYIWQDCSYNALKVPAEQLSRVEKKKEYVLLGLFNYFFNERQDHIPCRLASSLLYSHVAEADTPELFVVPLPPKCWD